jgi:hypothetical protein
MSNVISRNIPYTNHREVSSQSTAEWVNEIIRLAKDGYEVIDGSIIAYSLSKSCKMKPTGAEEIAPVEDEPLIITKEELLQDIEKEVVESVAGNDLGIDYVSIKSFDGDKNKLEDYAKEAFAIDLNRTRTFKNMVKDLEKELKARE